MSLMIEPTLDIKIRQASLSENRQSDEMPTEPSRSAHILGLSIKTFQPRRYPLYFSFWHLARSIDNLIDEGTSYHKAQETLASQKVTTLSLLTDQKTNPQTILENELVEITCQIYPPLRHTFLQRYTQLLSYFASDLTHRVNLIPYSKPELDNHILWGFNSYFGILKIVLQDEDLSNNQSYRDLTITHGQAEPLGDIAEDLERGLILHSEEDGASWIKYLQTGAEVPYREIDQYVIGKRGSLAKKMFQQAPAAHREFRGVIGALMILDYYNRAFNITRWHFNPSKPVIFAQSRMYP